MKTRHRIGILLVLLVLVLVLPTAAFANKRLWKAQLTTGAELHEVVGSSARGSMTLGTNPDGSLRFLMSVRGLSSDVTGAHLHGPADATQNAPVIITLCGNPAPSAAGSCNVVDGVLIVEGNITPSLLAAWGLSGGTFFNYLNNDLVYVNVHTLLNPAGEARGQLIGQ